jgi:Fe-Mn family superoxide dismutase
MTAAYSLPDLTYDYGALQPHLAARILELHHGQHHAAYVAGANTTLEKLAAARADGDTTNLVGLSRTLAFNVSGHVLHSLYWQNMSPDGGGEPTGALAEAIGTDFGSFAAFRSSFSATAASVQGSGWAMLSYEPIGRRLHIDQLSDHHENAAIGGVPLLTVDVWEHAYYLQYANRRADYIEAWWNVVAWHDVQRRLEAAGGAESTP